MQHKLTFFLSSLQGALIILMILGIPVALVYPDQPLYWLRACIILPVFFVSAISIRRIKSLAVYLLTAILLSGSLFLIGSSLAEQIYLTAAGAIVFLIRIPARLNQEHDLLDTPGLFGLLVFGISYIGGLAVHSETVCLFAYRLAFCYLIVLILHTNLSNMESYLKQNRDIANIPGHQILSTNRIMLLIFCAAALTGMLFLPASGLSSLFYRLGDCLLWLVRAFFSRLGSKEEPEVIPETTAAEASQNQMLSLPADSSPAWLTELLNILSFLLAGIILLALLAGLVYCLIGLFRRFYRPVCENDDRQEFIKKERSDTSVQAQRKKRETSLLFSFSPDAVIRKVYKRSIRKGISASAEKRQTPVPGGFSPDELEDYAGLARDAHRETLHALYEKARYSNLECTREDAARLKH